LPPWRVPYPNGSRTPRSTETSSGLTRNVRRSSGGFGIVREEVRPQPLRRPDGAEAGEVVVRLDLAPERLLVLRRPEHGPGRAVAGLRHPQLHVDAVGVVAQRLADRIRLQLADEARQHGRGRGVRREEG